MNLEQQVVELEKALQTLTESHHTALEVERKKVRELEAQLADIKKAHNDNATEAEMEKAYRCDVEKERDELKAQLAQAQAAAGELEAAIWAHCFPERDPFNPPTGRYCIACGNKHENHSEGCMIGNALRHGFHGWLSPDEAKALQTKIAAYDKLWNDMHFTICKLEQDLRKAKGEQ